MSPNADVKICQNVADMARVVGACWRMRVDLADYEWCLGDR
jgi:hypothetical protein